MKNLIVSLLITQFATLNTSACLTRFTSTVNIARIPKVKILQALYRNAQPFGVGKLHYKPNHELSDDEAIILIATSNNGFVDYVYGRPIKVQFLNVSDILCTEDYNQYNGENLAETVIEQLRKQ